MFGLPRFQDGCCKCKDWAHFSSRREADVDAGAVFTRVPLNESGQWLEAGSNFGGPSLVVSG